MLVTGLLQFFKIGDQKRHIAKPDYGNIGWQGKQGIIQVNDKKDSQNMRLEDAERAKLNAADINAYTQVLNTLKTHAIIANLSPTTQRDYEGYAKRFFAYLVVYRNGVSFDQVTYEDCRAFVFYLIEHKIAPRTINCYISTLVKLYYCVRHEQFDNREVPYQKLDVHLPHPVSLADFAAMYAACQSNFERAFICLLYSSGMRVSEALSARFQDIRRAENLIYVGPSKGRCDRVTLISSIALQAIEAYYKDFYKPLGGAAPDARIFQKLNRYGELVPMTYEDARALLKRLLKATHLQDKGYTLHSFRHGFVVELYRKTNDLMLVTTLMGHKHLNATEIYVKLASVYKIQEKRIPNPLDAALNNPQE